MMVMVILIFISVVLFQLFYKHKHYKKYKDFYNLPTPFYCPIIGNTYKMVNKNILIFINELLKKYGNPCVCYFPHKTYITSKPEEIKILLNHPNVLEKSLEYNHLKIYLKKSLMLAPVDDWRRQRKMISKSFKIKILESFVGRFYLKSENLLKMIEQNKFNNDVYTLFREFTLDAFCEASIGIKSNIMGNKNHKFLSGVKEAQRLAFTRIGNIIKQNDLLFSFMTDGKLMKKKITDMHEFISGVILEKRKNRDQINEDPHNLPLLDLLLQESHEKKLTDDYIQEEMIMFASAATNTTAHTIAFTCCLLGMHQEIQEKVYEEVMTVIGPDKEIDKYHLGLLKYTEMTINEVMRLCPVVPMVARKTTADIDLENKIIPANTGVILNFFCLHRDENIYLNPLIFDPKRFSSEEIAKRPEYSFLPFSGGPRNCIGFKYAMMLMKTTIANIVRKFKITSRHKSVNDFKLISNVVMTTTHPLNCKFNLR
ncbi:unnamed protein product [Brassicogethes aeneus]|uniref:Cytochrome P450 n=1 Tax=Brassicogethes aeneus TaxID=1431903 RepID=A0A9P0FM43_BRAAE|nr:unnamed protein product [Brassicogethes aeneus]